MDAILAIRKAGLTERRPDTRAALLVSVRDAQEASAALDGGAGVIDIKEPNAGPLGGASIPAISSVIEAVAGAVPVTAAAGELRDRFPLECLPMGVSIAKLGLAGSSRLQWTDLAERRMSRLPAGTAGALVAYADWQSAGAPTPEEILAHAIKIGCRGFVVDTWSKDGRSSLDLLGGERIRLLVEEATVEGLVTVIAGSITAERIEEAACFCPALVGVRGAACSGGRSGAVESQRVRALAQRLDACRRDG